jgi:hypothetical protein
METDYPVLAQLRSPAGTSSLATWGVFLRSFQTSKWREPFGAITIRLVHRTFAAHLLPML